MRNIRVVVIDDSAYNRRTISRMLEALPNVEVVGSAADGEEGIRKVIDLKPDLVTLDLEMPRMDGFTLLRIIMNACPTPVIVISSQSEDERVFRALELGAVDFLAKPTSAISEELLKITDDLHSKVKNVFDLNMKGISRRKPFIETAPPAIAVKARVSAPAAAPQAQKSNYRVVAIGASTGGPPALQRILSAFPAQIPFAVFISQHMPSGFTRAFADRLNRASEFEIKEAADGDTVSPGKVYIAPGGRNMVFQELPGGVVVRIKEPTNDDKYVPSVDAMFSSLADIYGSRLLAVVLTGMGNDGSRGVSRIKSSGGHVLAEAEESAVVFGMPREAIATGVVDKVAPLENMAREILLRSGLVPENE